MNSFISSSKRMPAAFLSAVLLVILTQAVIVRSDDFWRLCYFFSLPKEDDPIRIESQLRLMREGSKERRIFLAGSSQTRAGYDTDYLNLEFRDGGLVFYKLGGSGMGPVEMFMIKDAMLEKSPQTIVVTFFVGSFYTPFEFIRMRHYFNPVIIPPMIKHLGISRIFEEAEFYLRSFLGQWFIFNKHRESLGRIMAAVIKHYAYIDRKTAMKKYAREETRPKSYFEEVAAEVIGPKYKVCLETALYQELFIQFAKDVTSKGIKLIVLTGPAHPLLKSFYEREIDDAYEKFLSEQASNIGYAYLSEKDLPVFTDDEFIFDFVHLNAKGRMKFSKFLAAYLAK